MPAKSGQNLRVKVPYTLTVDTRRKNMSLKKYQQLLQVWMYNTSNVPVHFEYEFFVEYGKKGNPHAHGWFMIDEDDTSVLVNVMKKYKRKFGFVSDETNRRKHNNGVGHTWESYSQKEQSKIALHIFNKKTQDIKICRANGAAGLVRESKTRQRLLAKCESKFGSFFPPQTKEEALLSDHPIHHLRYLLKNYDEYKPKGILKNL